MARNDEVAACVLASARDGVAFTYASRGGTGQGQFGGSAYLHVDADGRAWRLSVEAADLCQERTTTIYEAVDFDGCEDFDCVDRRIQGADRAVDCGTEMLREGV